MDKTYRPYDPDQLFLMPPSLRDWLPTGHLAYFVSDVVDGLDLSPIHQVYEREARGYGLHVEQWVCRHCSLIQTSPCFDQDSLSRFYSVHYRLIKEGQDELAGYQRRFQRQRKKGRALLGRLRSHLTGRSPADLEVAEVGCGRHRVGFHGAGLSHHWIRY